MKNIRYARCLLMLVFLASFAGFGTTAFGEGMTPVDGSKTLAEMPVLTGKLWQQMSQDAKTAFVWGIGHVVTIQKHVMERHPELKRSDFTEKLSEGLTGVPMERIVGTVDAYYRDHADQLETPVMRVIWRQMVKPKLTLGIADQPINRETDSAQ